MRVRPADWFDWWDLAAESRGGLYGQAQWEADHSEDAAIGRYPLPRDRWDESESDDESEEA